MVIFYLSPLYKTKYPIYKISTYYKLALGIYGRINTSETPYFNLIDPLAPISHY